MPRDSKLTLATAKQINEQHRLAKQHASTAIEHAIMCGQMLADKKEQIGRGGFDEWVEKNCDFSRATAYNYIKVSKLPLPMAIEMSAIRHLFPSGKPAETAKESDKSSRALDDSVKTAAEKAPFSAAHNESPTKTSAPVEAPKIQAAPPSILSDDWQPEIPGDEEMAAIEREVQEAEARVLQADDITAGYHAELKRQAAEIAVLKVARDGYMLGKNQITKMLQAEQRKTARLEKELERIRGSHAA